MSDINVTVTNAGSSNVTATSSNTYTATVGNGGAVNVAVGTVSPGNATVVAGTLTINSTTTLNAGQAAYAKNVGTAYAASLDLGIPAGPATLVTVGNTTTLAAGSNATVTSNLSGNNLTLAFGIPRGVTPSFAIGSVTTGAAGSSASVTATTLNSGANVTLDLTIPRGDPGTSGSNGTNGTAVTLSDGTPANLGTAAAGTSTLSARADHVHNLPTTFAYANLSGVPTNFPTNTTLVSGLSSGYSAANHAHNYVTAFNNLTGSLTLAAGTNVNITANGSTLTLSSTGGITANDSIDGGDYIGELLYGITFGTQPQSVSAATTFSSWSNVAPISNSSAAVFSALYAETLGKYYASLNEGSVLSSSNLASWQTVTVPNLSHLVTGVTSNGTRTVMAAIPIGYGQTTNNAYATTYEAWYSDGSSWTAATTTAGGGSSYGFQSVVFGAGKFVALLRNLPEAVFADGSRINTNLIKTSTDGTTWSTRSLPNAYGSGISLSYGSGVFVATFENGYDSWNGSGYPNNYTRYATSTDGINWTSRTIPGATGAYRPMSVASNGTVHVMVVLGSDPVSGGFGTAVNTAYTSTDGVTWTSRTLPSSARWSRVVYAAGRFVLTSPVGSTDVITSTDGVTWTLGDLGVAASSVATGNTTTIYAPPAYASGYGRSASATTASANLTVSASVSGGAAVSYQWQSSLDAGTTWANVSNATSSTLTLTGLTTANSGTRYRAAASATGATTAYSQSATLTVSG
jgi:hypothetical protein